jgi:CRISPR-associated protein Cmr6
MRAPIIQLAGLGRDRRPESQHPGLILQRYSKPVAEKDRRPAEKRALLEAAIQAAKCEPLHRLYKLAYERWARDLLGGGPHRLDDLKTQGRLIVGLGSENVLETGIRLHHTYGLPLIPGSALKGLASHYCDRAWGQSEENRLFRKDQDYHKLLFGTAEETEAAGGIIIFHDAWIIPESVKNGCLLLDVMTPHHPEWQTDERAPTDFDSPSPISFLSVHGTFRVAVSWAGPPGHPEGDRWTNLASTLLKEALRDWGIGGKSSSGYGRLVSLTSTITHQVSRPAPSPAGKRPPKAPARVQIVAPRPKGGFDVRESGRQQGTLTLGTPPTGISTNVGDEVDVLVHNDEPKCPQYRWPDDRPSKPKSGPAKKSPRDPRR